MEYNKILFSRLIYSVLWTILLQVFPLSFFVCLTNFSILHPLEWLSKPIFVVVNINSWILLMPLNGLIFLIGYTLYQEHKKPRCLLNSRFKYFCNLFTKLNFLKAFLYFSFGCILPWIYLKFNDASLLLECLDSSDKICLQEKTVFLMTCGIWTAISYFLRYDILTEKHLQYPIIRQQKFLQIRYKFLTTFHSCLTLSLFPLFYFLPFYLWYGRQIIVLFELFFSASIETSKLSGINLLSISTLVEVWSISTAVFSIFCTLELMIQIHFTEHYSFALIKQPNDSDSFLLSHALGEQSMPIIQHLGCYDLYILSMSQKSIRWHIFTLSQPGGHPHTWNAILQESLKLMEEFICKIDNIYKVTTPLRPESPIPRHIHARNVNVRYEKIISGPVPLSPVNKFRNLVEHPAKSPVKKEQKSLVDEVWHKIDSLIEVIKQNSVVNYLFNPKPDAEIYFLLSNSQPLIWVVQSISELSANALFEDQFGIVLKDLPLIISTLLRLKTSVEKIGNLQNKFQKQNHELCMKASLKSALKRSLYRIAIAYSDYLTDLPLSNENLSCMKNFVNFRES